MASGLNGPNNPHISPTEALSALPQHLGGWAFQPNVRMRKEIRKLGHRRVGLAIFLEATQLLIEVIICPQQRPRICCEEPRGPDATLTWYSISSLYTSISPPTLPPPSPIPQLYGTHFLAIPVAVSRIPLLLQNQRDPLTSCSTIIRLKQTNKPQITL